MSLLDNVANERVRGLQVEDVELVDRRRDDDQRPLERPFGERLVLNKLDQFVLEDDGARRDGEIAADLESLLVGHRDAALADVVDQVLDSGRQAFAARLHRKPQRLRIAGEIIRRAERIQDLARKEAQSAARSLVAGGAVNETV